MNIVYLGVKEEVYEWVMGQILTPVAEFVAEILSVVIDCVIIEILLPLLINVFVPLYIEYLQIYISFWGAVIFSGFAALLKILDVMQLVFDLFAGLENVTMDGKSYTLLEALFRLDIVQSAIMVMILISVVLTIFCAILATTRSMMDIEGETNRPVSKVLFMTGKALVQMLLIPFTVLVMISISTVMLNGISIALANDSNSISSVVFTTASLNAAKNGKYNLNGIGSDGALQTPSSDIGISDPIRKPFYEGQDGYSYTSVTQVNEYFMLGEFDYIVGFGSAIFLVVVFFMAILTFLTRVFEILLLFLVAPFFAAVMPLDDGEKMKAWKELFVGKIFSGYGTVISMQLFMMIAPSVMSGSLSFGQNSTEVEYLTRLIFLIGGGWTVLNAGPLVTQIISYQAAMGERETQATAMTVPRMAYYQAKSVAYRAKGYLSNAMNKKKGGQGGGGQGFSAKKALRPKNKKLQGLQGRRLGIYTGADKKKHLGINFGNVLSRGESADGRSKFRFMGFGFDRSKNADGSRSLDKVRIPFISAKRDANNNFKVSSVKLGPVNFARAETLTNDKGKTTRTLGSMYVSDIKPIGMHRRYNQDTKHIEQQNSIKLPFTEFKPDSNGDLHTASVNLGFMKFSRAENVTVGEDKKETRTFGGMYVSDIAPIGLHRSYNQHTKETMTDSVLGVHISHGISEIPSATPATSSVTPAASEPVAPSVTIPTSSVTSAASEPVAPSVTIPTSSVASAASEPVAPSVTIPTPSVASAASEPVAPSVKIPTPSVTSAVSEPVAPSVSIPTPAPTVTSEPTIIPTPRVTTPINTSSKTDDKVHVKTDSNLKKNKEN